MPSQAGRANGEIVVEVVVAALVGTVDVDEPDERVVVATAEARNVGGGRLSPASVLTHAAARAPNTATPSQALLRMV